MRFLSSLRIIQRLERAIDALPPYVILVLMAVPFGIAELAKVFALFWMSQGHLRSGMTIFIGAYIVSIYVFDRIINTSKNKLMTIRWFAVIYTWVMSVRDRIFGWFRDTWIWRTALDIRRRAGASLRNGFDRLRSAIGIKPRGILERR